MRFDIEPKIGLGNFILGMNINQVLTFIKRNGYYFKNCKIITNKEKNSPIFLHIPSELITLRFNYFTQNLELIEKQIIYDPKDITNQIESDNDGEYYYKNKLFYMKNKNNEFHIIKYQNIAQLFGLSKVPKKLNKNKNVFLEYSGIGFYFSNEIIDLEKSEELDISSDPSSIDTNSILSKFFIFKEDSLYDSLSKNNIFETNNILIKYDTSKAKSISIKRDDESNKSVISIGDNIEDVLRELKNPNYIYYCNENNETYNQSQENGDVKYNQTYNKMFYLNYFNYGFDIMILNNKVHRIILHTNQIEDSKFGIYERCNFKLKLRKDYLSSLLKIDYKISEINDKKDSIPKEKEKNKSRKSSQNEQIQVENKKEFNEKDGKESKNKEKEIENNVSKKELEDNSKKNEAKEIKIQDEVSNNNQCNNSNSGNLNSKQNNKTELQINEKDKENNQEKKEEKDVESNKDKKDKNIIEEKENKKDNNKIISSSNESQKVTNEVKENFKDNNTTTEKIKNDSTEKITKEEDINKIEDKKEEKKDVEKGENDEEENKKEEEAKKGELAKKEEEQKKEEENKQSQNNIYASNKNNRRKRKKHGNPPKRERGNNLDEDNKENEKEEDKNNNEKKKNDFQKSEEKSKNKDGEYLTIFPWTNFKEEFLAKIEYNKNLRQQKWDEGTSKIVNCYFFNGLLFEIIDRNVIGTIIIY